MATCEKCGKQGSALGYDVRIYSCEDHIDRILCKDCYQRVQQEIFQRRTQQAVPTIYCHNCGKPIRADYKLCPYCGQKF